MIVQRVEKHIIKQNNKYYSMLDDFCFKAKNLYNHANYVVRNIFCSEDRWVRFQDLDKILRNDSIYPDYRNMPTAQSAQQILRLLDNTWKSFFKSIKDWSKNKEKYLGRPKLPSYKKKDGRCILLLTNQNVKLKENTLYFPKVFNGLTINPKFIEREDFKSFQQVRFIPKQKHIVLELVYNIEVTEEKEDNGRYMSIDIGVDNLATVTNNYGENPYIVDGKGLKSMNQYYNKTLSELQSGSKKVNDRYSTNRIVRFTYKRNNKVRDYIHKASRLIIDRAIENSVSVIVIGYNKGWKQSSVMSKKTNQKFIQIPFNDLISQIQYKAQEVGIKVIVTEESYTSGTSFLDNELPTKENYNKNRRIKRGLFKSNNGTLINADVNASLQILKKVFSKGFNLLRPNEIEGVVLHPVRVYIN